MEVPPSGKIQLEVDKDDAFDYAKSESYKFKKDDYLMIFLKEADEVHTQRMKFLSGKRIDSEIGSEKVIPECWVWTK